jgi:hypothetical protein
MADIQISEVNAELSADNLGPWNLYADMFSEETTHEPLHLDKRSMVHWKIIFVWIIIFFNRSFEYGNGGIFRLVRWMQNMHQLTCDHIIGYADISSEDEKRLLRPLTRKTKNMTMAGSWLFKFTFYYFVEITHEPLLFIVKWVLSEQHTFRRPWLCIANSLVNAIYSLWYMLKSLLTHVVFKIKYNRS